MVKIENLNIKYKEGFELRPVNQSIEKGEIVSVVKLIVLKIISLFNLK